MLIPKPLSGTGRRASRVPAQSPRTHSPKAQSPKRAASPHSQGQGNSSSRQASPKSARK
ncbi:hypothetical protein B484DRAFT_448407 [Ochromonadaceae sp. CCMP2298]|nr:hypothetical protein B484DRAFT_448407 [Ochromonadaceae sp. CCMP2298]